MAPLLLPQVNPYLPVEFSAATYRFGHSQIRDEYSTNGSFQRWLFDPNGEDFPRLPAAACWLARVIAVFPLSSMSKPPRAAD